MPEPAGSNGLAVTVVLCSEHGFVGGYNERLIEGLRDGASAGRKVGIVGRRGAGIAREMGLDPAWELPMASQVPGAPAVARRIAARIADADTISIIGANYRSGGRFEIAEKPVLPLDPQLMEGGTTGPEPLHHLDPVRLLARLGSEYVLAEILHALMEAMASENVERLSVMRAAEDTIDDRLEKLGARERVLRQEEITSELLDIVTGAEAAGLNG
jgi:F-type H+-transporting ATPase subunit gamma